MNKNLIIVAATAVILFAGGFLFLSNNQTEAPTESDDSMMVDEDTMTEEESLTDDESMDDDSMSDDAMMEDTVEIAMEGVNYAFDPDNITVEAGQQVELTLTSTQGMHDFVVEGTDIATEIIQQGDSGTITFTAPDEPGEYTFYCSVGNHRALGMEGTMIVE